MVSQTAMLRGTIRTPKRIEERGDLASADSQNPQKGARRGANGVSK